MDYQKIGLKCGLEIHQQLDTGKLYSRVKSSIRDDEPDFEVKRFLRATAGETGEIDAAAKAEKTKNKHYIYQGYKENSSLIEFDEEPPQPMDEEALFVTLQACKLMKSDIVDNIRVMRKTVIDGSNTSGFQRTALVALGGKVEGVDIETVCLEEDSAKIVQRTPEHDTYNLSRLGIPLIEIATAPQIHSPQQAQDVALAIGLLLRSTGKVKRGLGTIRQDLNISITGGARIEMKGVQDLKLIPTYVELEVQRQINLLQIFKELKGKAESTIHDVTKLFQKSEAKVIQSALKSKGAVLAIKMSGFKGFLGREVQPGRRLGTEFSDYAKTQGVKGLFHSDELPKYGITEQEVKAVRTELKLGKNDAFILIADKKDVAQRSLQAVIQRANQPKIIKEVRQAKPDGTSSFLRPMPGAARMYPETDIPSITPKLDIPLPELIPEKEKRFIKQYKLSKDFAASLAKGGYPFDEYAKTYNIDPTFLAQSLLTTPKELKKRYDVELDNYEDALKQVLDKLNQNKISSQAVIDILAEIGKGKAINWNKYKPFNQDDLDSIIKEQIQADPQAPIGALMGRVMAKLQGRADGKTVMERLKKLR